MISRIGRAREFGLAVIILLALAGAALLIVIRSHRGRIRRLAVIPKTTATDFWEGMHMGVLAGAKDANVEITWNAPPSEADYAEQARMVEDAIRLKVNGIILAPSQESVLASSVRHAKGEGIPVVVVDSPVAVTPDHYLAYIGSNNVEIGELAARRMGTQLHGEGEVAILGVSPTVGSSVVTEKAFTRAIASYYPKINIVDLKYGLSNDVQSRTLTTDLMQSHPNLRGLFALDEFATRGASSALREYLPNRSIILIGVAQEQDMLDLVRQGSVDSLVVQDPYRMGYLAVEALRHGENMNHSNLETGVTLATRETVDSQTVRDLVSHYGGAR